MVNYGFLSTYPPTQCGLATFCAALLRHLANPMTGSRCGVVQVADGAYQTVRQDPAAALVTVRPLGASRAAEVLNRYDVLIVQHEYGIYGGLDGEDVLDVLDRAQVPVITVLHTVLALPTPHQRLVLQRVIDASDAVVVLSQSAAATLKAGYLIADSRVSVIPHGAAPLGQRRPSMAGGPRPTILTWGLIGPGKGIEWGIEALGHLSDLQPAVRYLVAGQTHPKVLTDQGEAYRDKLRRQARTQGVLDLVEFDPTYREVGALMNLVRRADVVLLPYDSSQQVTSGVLIEAVAALRPVVATGFPHARELLAGGAGIVVPHRDPRAMAHAIRRVLTEPGLAEAMTSRCAALAPALTWSAVADSYRMLAASLLAAPAAVAS